MKNIVLTLQEVAKRGYNSEPVQHWLNKDDVEQVVTFYPEELKEIRAFLGDNQYLAKVGRHSISSIFGGETRTMSLLERIDYAITSKHISPSYVVGLATELDECVEYRTALEVAELNAML